MGRMDGEHGQHGWPFGDWLQAAMWRYGHSQRDAADKLGMNQTRVRWMLKGRRDDGKTLNLNPTDVLKAVRYYASDEHPMGEADAMRLTRIRPHLYVANDDGTVSLDTQANAARLNASPVDPGRRYFDHLWSLLSPKQKSRLLDLMESMANPQWDVPADDVPLEPRAFPENDEGPGPSSVEDAPGPAAG